MLIVLCDHSLWPLVNEVRILILILLTYIAGYFSGNPWPPVIPQPKDTRNLLPNILLHELRKEYRQEKAQKLQQQESVVSEGTESAKS